MLWEPYHASLWHARCKGLDTTMKYMQVCIFLLYSRLLKFLILSDYCSKTVHIYDLFVGIEILSANCTFIGTILSDNSLVQRLLSTFG